MLVAVIMLYYCFMDTSKCGNSSLGDPALWANKLLDWKTDWLHIRI